MLNNKKIIACIFLVVTAAVIVVLIGWNTGPFFYHFSEWRLITIYSFFQLLATSFACFLACKAFEPRPSLNWRKIASIRPYLLFTVGFAYLGLDEVLSLHENIDKLIHHILLIKETPMTDHIDDVIVLVYGLIALVFIKDFIREFKKRPFMIPMLICGFIMFFAMFGLDYVTNSKEQFVEFFGNASYADLLHKRDIYRMAEDSAKILGESFFLAAFLGALVDIRTGQNKG